MKTHCPKCNSKYEKPQPDDYFCGECLFAMALIEIAKIQKLIVIIEEKQSNNID